ncbi:hypothetical protein HELRODRAFT_159665 [Helobdella robusta]|uniref:Uncharacterized protein n=1 Tax=Helobdella robusta TaxID=6412 RepID=T1EPA5_HELRO|nr:hypothetical protein HELRODRAFT_159665 [Helobdella robusta]ESO13065.1 hypothetical protein HELRODRAFT_159665 [Helobdella robusta]
MTNFITGTTTNATVHVMTSSSTSPTDSTPLVIGYVAALVSTRFFGSNFLPVKKFRSGNGIFFQWVLCSGVWSTGVMCFAIRGFPTYRPLSMIGGWIWCTGSIGMGKGLLVWGAVWLFTGGPHPGLDYIFPHFTGIFMSSTAYLLVYCALARNNPIIYPNIILPGFVSGLMWGTACIAFFHANSSLSESITFPIITTGWKNYAVLTIAISIGVQAPFLLDYPND